MTLTSLPVAEQRSRIMDAIRSHQVTLVVGPTGSGKTTQVPQFLLDSEYAARGMIACTEPKRIAAIAAASRIASERQSEVGQEVGYVIRYERQTSEATKLCFATVGVLLRESMSDPYLSKYSCVIVDEAHERDVFTDFLLGYLKKVCQQRPEFRIVVMSATLRYQEFLTYFPKSKHVIISERQHQVTIVHRETDIRNLTKAAADAVQEIHRSTPAGDILVFMPGEKEIRGLIDQLKGRKLQNVRYLPLYGSMGPTQQRLVFQSYRERKVIVATNIAESSLTINNLAFVIDSGLAKEEGFDAYADVRTLELRRISQSSAEQRAGRTGRNGPGVCVRLFSEDDLRRRSKYPDPSITRQDLTALLLAMKTLHLGKDFDFLTEPSPEQWEHAEQSLRDFGAIDDSGQLNDYGQSMAKLSLDPRLAHFVLQSIEYGCVQEAVTIAAMLTVGRFFVRELYEQEEFRLVKNQFSDPESDFLTLLNIWDAYHATENVEAWCRDHFVNPYWMRGVEKIREQTLNRLAYLGIPSTSNRNRDLIDMAILAAFKHNTLRFHRGTLYENRRWDHVELAYDSVLGERTPQYVVCYELRSNGAVYAYCNHQVQYAWVKELAPEVLDHQPMALPEGVKPVRLNGELEVEVGRRKRTVKVDIDLARSGATIVRAHDGRKIVMEESRFPVTLLGLSDRARTAINEAGITTLAELPNSGQELSDLGMSNTPAAEILRVLDRLGLVRRSSPLEPVIEPRLVSQRVSQPAPTNRIEEAILDKPIEHLKLSGRALMVLWGIGIQTIRQLTELTEKELIVQVKEYGKAGGKGSSRREINAADVAQEVKARLMHFNLRLTARKDTSRGFNADLDTMQLPADPLDEERAIDMLGLWYPYFKAVRMGDSDDKFSRNVIAEANLGLPGRFCRNVYWYWKMVDDPMLEYADLFQEGCMGLLWAIEKYDYTRGFKLSTYAVQWITQYVYRAMDNATMLPVHQIDKLRWWGRQYHRLAHKMGTEPTRAEFAGYLGKSEREVEAFYSKLQYWRHFASLDQPAKNGSDESEGSSIGDLIEAPEEPIEDRLDAKKLQERVEKILNETSLQDVDKEILRLRHGLSGERPHTLEEVGEFLGVTRERVRQREARALEQLRTMEVWEQITEFMPSLPMPTSRPMEFIVDDSGTVAKQKVSELKVQHSQPPSVDEVVDAVAEKYGLTRADLLTSQRRDDLVVIPRRIAMHLLHVDCRLSNVEIGELFGLSRERVRMILATSPKHQIDAQPILDGIYRARDGKETPTTITAVGHTLTADAILDVVAEYYSVSRDDLLADSRKVNVVVPRHVAMFLIREELQLSYPEIGAIFNRDHTTILAACQKVLGEIQKVPESKGVMNSLRQRLATTGGAS